MKRTISLYSFFTYTIAFVLLFSTGVSIAQSSGMELNFVSWGVYSGPSYIAVNGDHMYVSSNAFVVFDISDRYNPVETTHFRPMEPGIPQELVVNGNYAYVLWSGGDGIRVFDISNDDTVLTISTGFGAGANPSNFYLKFPYLYAFTQPSSDIYFSIVGISDDSTSLYNVGSFNLAESLGTDMGHYPAQFIVVGDYAYLTFAPRDTIGTAVLHILDISSPDSISIVGSLDLGTVDASVAGMRNGPHLKFGCKDTFLYITGRFEQDTAFGDTNFVELKILNIAEPESVFIAGKFYSTFDIRNIGDIDISGDYAYVMDRDSRLFALDISDPLNPIEHGNTRMDVPDYYPLDFNVQVDGNYAYLNMWDFYAVCIVDISDPDSLEEIHEIEFGHQLNDMCISRSDSNAYLAVWDYLQLYVVDSMETSPVVINRSVVLGMGWGIDVKSDYAYLAMGPASYGNDTVGGLHIFDISDPLFPVQVGQCSTVAPIDSNHIVQVFVDTTEMLAYTVIGEPHYPPCTFDYSKTPGMLIIDVSDPTNPFQLGTYFIDPLDTMEEQVQATDICKSGNYAYLATNRKGVHIIDVGDPLSPTLAAIWSSPTPRAAEGIFIKDTLLYIAYGDSLCIVDVANPVAPFEIGGYYIGDGCIDVYVKDTLAFVISSNALRILNISDPTSPVELASEENVFCGTPSHIDVLGSYVYIQIFCGGLYTFEYSDTSTVIAEEENVRPENIQVDVQPNPFNSSCRISVPADATVEIYDLRGNLVVGATRWVAQQQGDATHRPYIWTPDASISSGIYLIKAKMEDGRTMTKRIVYVR